MRESTANVLAQCLEAVQEGRQSSVECLARYPEHSDELLPLIEMAGILSAAPEVRLRPAFRQTARRRLLARLPERRPVTAGRIVSAWDRLVARWQFGPGALYGRRVVAIVMGLSVLAGVLLGGGRIVSASERALPGDALYPVKVAVEESRLALSDDERAFGLYLTFTQTRIDELERLSTAQRFEDVPEATTRLERQVQGAIKVVEAVGGRDAERSRVLAEQLDVSLSAHRARLEHLLQSAPDSVRPALERAIRDVGDEDEDGSMEGREGQGVEEDEQEPPNGDAGREQGHEPDDVEVDEADPDLREQEPLKQSTPDLEDGDDREGGSGRLPDIHGSPDDREDSVEEGGGADVDSNSGEGEVENALEGDDPDDDSGEANREARDVDEGDAPDGNADLSEGDDDSEGSRDGADDPAGDPSGSSNDSDESSDDDSESEPGERSGPDKEDSESSGDGSAYSREDESDGDSTADRASGSDEASGSDDAVGSDDASGSVQERQDRSEDDSNKYDGDR